MDKGIRILMFEDVPTDAELIEYELQNAGVEFVLVRVDSREAFQKALIEFAPDLILSDYSLPSFDGLSAFTIAHEEKPDIPFILVTGVMGEEFAIEALRNGVTDYVLKSNLKRLVPVVKRALQEAEERSRIRQMEQALQESEKLYRLLAENTSDMITCLLPDSTYLYVSPASRVLFGYEPEELIGTKAFDQIHPADVKIMISLAQEAVNKGGSKVVQYRHLTKEGQYVWVETAGKVIKNERTGNIEDIICVVRDITERKLTADELHRSEEQYRMLFHKTPAGVFRYDNQLCITECNQRFLEILQSTREALLGLDMKSLKDQSVLSAIQRALEGEEGVYEGIYSVTTSPVKIWISMRTAPVFDQKDVIRGGIGIVEDITVRKETEERIQVINKLLRLFTQTSSRSEYFDAVADLMQGYTGCRCSGIRVLNTEGKIPYESSAGFSKEFLETEHWLSINREGCVCVRIQAEKSDSTDFSCVTPSGSFYCNDMRRLSNGLLDEECIRFRDMSLREGLLSIAIIPIPYRNEIVGAIHIADTEEGSVPLKIVESIETVAPFIGEAIHRYNLEEELHGNYFTEATINMILSESLKDIPLEEILQKALNMILSVPWIGLETIGSIHLVEGESRTLVMKAEVNLPKPLIKLCTQVPLGRCICGRAALTQQIEYADHVDERHDICYEGMPSHSHYAVPVLYSGRTVGILNLYLEEGHVRNKKEDDFFRTVADTLAGIIVRKQTENELQESSRKLTALINNLPGFAYKCTNDPLWTMEYLSEGVLELTGYPAEEFIGNRIRSFASVIEPEDNLGIAEIIRRAIDEKEPYTLEYRIITSSGKLKWVWERGSGVFAGEKLLALEGFITDITERKTMESRIEYLAYYDDLTDLPNRNLFLDRVTQGTARAEYSKKLIAVLTIDIDRFKSINDTYGMDTGDAVLQEMAKRLLLSVRDGDSVARLGNDDFGILLIDIAESGDIILVIEKIMKNAFQPIHFHGKEIVLTLSIGISVYPHDGNDAPSLIKNADLALTRAKQQGRKNYQFYTQDMNTKAAEFVQMEKHLFNAIQNEEFILHYQPYWDINTKKIVGVEALVRWKSPELGWVSPGKFIPVLEDTRMIIEVGEWILRTAIAKAKEWQDKGHTVFPVSVNLSLIQFRQKDLSAMIEQIIRKAGFSPSLLTLEITESAFMQDIEYTYSVLESLKHIGVSVSVDDFGTGYSSLAHLKRFPIDNLKIDISFIRDIALDPDTASIVTAIIAMAHTLNLKTIAEGIETEEQWKILRLLRCDMGQGYYVSAPLPAEEIEKLLLVGILNGNVDDIP